MVSGTGLLARPAGWDSCDLFQLFLRGSKLERDQSYAAEKTQHSKNKRVRLESLTDIRLRSYIDIVR